MKKYLYILLLPLLLLWGCEEKVNPEPEPDPVEGKVTLQTTSPIVLPDEGAVKQVAFSATLDWTATSSENWLKVSPASGKAGENLNVNITAEANTAYDPRTATLTIKCGEDSKSVQISQKQKGALVLTESTITVAAEGGKVTITAKANSNVTAAIASDAQSWITDITTKGLIDYNFEFDVQANPEESPRSGQIVFSNESGSETVTIEQEAAVVQHAEIEASLITASSSSLVFGWSCCETVEEDAALPYTLALYKDEACTELALSFEVPAGDGCWKGKPLRFTFGGLEPATKYYFTVTDTQNGAFSDPVEGTTLDFTVVDPSKLSSASAGDVILAEDFSEISWGADMLATAAGFTPSGKPLEPMSGNYTNEDGSFLTFDNTAGRIYGETRVNSDKRLFNWGFFGNSSVYSYAGYLRVGSSSSGARTHIVSPALSCIPDGKQATIDVTVTSAKYESNDNDVAVFLESASSLTRALDPDQKENSDFNAKGGKFTGASLSDGYPLEAQVKEWSTKTVRIEGVTNNNCLLFGSYKNIDTKNRFFLSYVKVQIVSLEDSAPVEAKLGNATSSSLSFTWTEGVSAADDIAKPWTIALYKDAACTDLVVSHSISAEHGCWDNKQPRFVFGGLDQDTDYWFKAIDTTEGNVKESKAVKGTTLPFARVDASTVSNAGVGDIILGEDFSEVHYGPDEFDVAAGFMPDPRTLKPITGENPDGSFEKYSSTSTRLWGNKFEITEGTRLSHGWGFYGNSAVYSRVGYFRCATTSKNARTHIVTPKLKGIPDGYVATIEVTVTDRMYETNGDVGVFVASNLTMNSTTDVSSASFGKYTGSGALSNGHALGIKTGQWFTKSVVIEGVTNQDQLLIGSLENINVSDKSKNRHNFSDIVVKIVALEEPNRTTKVSIIGDSISTFAGWCDTTKGGAYYPKSDGDVTSVTDTWWHKLIYQKMSTGTFEKNISAGNTTIVQNTTGDSSAYWYGWDFGTRLQTLGIGEPDVVLIHGGTNDYGHTSWYNTSEELISGVAMNASSFPESAQDALDALFAAADAATTVSAADALDGTTFCSAYIRLISMILARHPDAKIVCVIGDYLRQGQADAVNLIAAHFGDSKVRVADFVGEKVSISKYSSPHPDAAGMTTMANFIYQKVGSWIDTE
jgi:hypothetical protein